MPTKNIFSIIPKDLPEEFFEVLLKTDTFFLERIISKGHSTPPGQWYDQEDNEWILLLQGKAGLLIEGQEQVMTLKPGDYLLLPAHVRHRVEWTDPAAETMWLALHFYAENK